VRVEILTVGIMKITISWDPTRIYDVTPQTTVVLFLLAVEFVKTRLGIRDV
jgi:hypothetical protein